jgi:hypothetical protein
MPLGNSFNNIGIHKEDIIKQFKVQLLELLEVS